MQSAHLKQRIRALTNPLEPRETGYPPDLRPLPGIRAVLFDVYGTLVISGSGDIGLTAGGNHEAPLAQALAAVGLQAAESQLHEGRHLLRQAIEARHRDARAVGIDYPEVDILDVWRQVIAELRLDLPTDLLPRLAVEYEFRVNPVWPMPGLAEVLRQLRDAGLVLGIVSNAQFYTPLMLEAMLGAPLPTTGFSDECSAWSYRLGRAKPSPRLYVQVAEGLRRGHAIPPQQSLYVGNDRRNDIWPAATAGFRTALFAGDSRSLRLRTADTELSGIVADRTITTLAQIRDDLLR